MMEETRSENKLAEFVEFMAAQYSRWQVTSKTDESVTFQNNIEAQKPSCLVALILFCLGIIPGIIYLVLANKPAQTLSFTAHSRNGAPLTATGSPQGNLLIISFNNFKSGKKALPEKNVWQKYKWWIVGLITVVLLPQILTLFVKLLNAIVR